MPMSEEQLEEILKYIGASQERQKATELFRDSLVRWMEKSNDMFALHTKEIGSIRETCASKNGIYTEFQKHITANGEEKKEIRKNWWKLGLAILGGASVFIGFVADYAILRQRVCEIWTHSYGVQDWIKTKK